MKLKILIVLFSILLFQLSIGNVSSNITISPYFIDSECQLSLDSDFYLYKDITKTIPASLDNDLIYWWLDISNYQNHALEPDPAAGPHYFLNQINGHPALRWDGSFDVLIEHKIPPRIPLGVAGLVSGMDRPYSLFIVYKLNVTDMSPNWNNCLFGWGNSNPGILSYVALNYKFDGSNFNFYHDKKDDAGTLKSVQCIEGSGRNTNWHYLSIINNGISVTIYLDGMKVLDNGDSHVGQTTVNWFIIGATAQASLEIYHSNISIAKLLIYGATLSDVDRLTIQDILKVKYFP